MQDEVTAELKEAFSVENMRWMLALPQQRVLHLKQYRMRDTGTPKKPDRLHGTPKKPHHVHGTPKTRTMCTICWNPGLYNVRNICAVPEQQCIS